MLFKTHGITRTLKQPNSFGFILKICYSISLLTLFVGQNTFSNIAKLNGHKGEDCFKVSKRVGVACALASHCQRLITFFQATFQWRTLIQLGLFYCRFASVKKGKMFCNNPMKRLLTSSARRIRRPRKFQRGLASNLPELTKVYQLI